MTIRSDNDVRKAEKAIYDKARRERLGQEWIDHSIRWVRDNREKHRQYCKTYRDKNRERESARSRDYHRRLRQEALNAYGGKCACCGESEWPFLAVDHVNGNGNEHRRKVGRGNSFFNWLKKSNWPADFQVLCHNCNQAKGMGLICPHKVK